MSLKHWASGAGPVADILTMTERLKRQGWDPRRAAEAAEYAVTARSGSSRLVAWANANGPEVRVPDVEQATNYTCGPAALQAALLALGVSVTEDELASLAHTTAVGGTSAAGLVEAVEAVNHKVSAEIVNGMDVDALVQCLEDGCIVLTCIQAREGEGDQDFSHWVVPTAVKFDGDGVVECVDPGVDGMHTSLSIDEWEERWVCYDEGEVVTGLGVVLRGPEPARIAVEQAQMAMK